LVLCKKDKQRTKIMNRQILTLGILVALIGLGAITWSQPTKGKIAPWDAMTVATKKIGGGKAHQATYVVENGKAIYDVIVIRNGKISEVAVDAMTGKAGAVEVVTPEEEGKEFTEELNVALGKKKATPEKEEKDEEDEKDEKPAKSGKGK
jgi:hypothetical protein